MVTIMRAGHDCACSQSASQALKLRVPLAEHVSGRSYHGNHHACACAQSVFLSAETARASGGLRKRVFLPWSPSCVWLTTARARRVCSQALLLRVALAERVSGCSYHGHHAGSLALKLRAPLAAYVSVRSYHGNQHACGSRLRALAECFSSAETARAIGRARERAFLPW